MRRSFKGIKHPPNALTKEETLRFLHKLRQGDKEAIDKLIKGHIRLVASIVARLSLTYPNKSEDLFGQGLLQLIICTNRVANGEAMQGHDNFSAYIHKSIQGYLQTYIKKDHVVQPPVNSLWLIKKLEKYNLSELFQEIEHIENLNPDSEEKFCHPGYIGRWDDLFSMMFNEIQDSDLFTDTEKWIIKKRLEGYTDTEIGKELRCTKMTVHNKRHAMKHRINYLLGGKK